MKTLLSTAPALHSVVRGDTCFEWHHAPSELINHKDLLAAVIVAAKVNKCIRFTVGGSIRYGDKLFLCERDDGFSMNEWEKAFATPPTNKIGEIVRLPNGRIVLIMSANADGGWWVFAVEGQRSHPFMCRWDLILQERYMVDDLGDVKTHMPETYAISIWNSRAVVAAPYPVVCRLTEKALEMVKSRYSQYSDPECGEDTRGHQINCNDFIMHIGTQKGPAVTEWQRLVRLA